MAFLGEEYLYHQDTGLPHELYRRENFRTDIEPYPWNQSPYLQSNSNDLFYRNSTYESNASTRRYKEEGRPIQQNGADGFQLRQNNIYSRCSPFNQSMGADESSMGQRDDGNNHFQTNQIYPRANYEMDKYDSTHKSLTSCLKPRKVPSPPEEHKTKIFTGVVTLVKEELEFGMIQNVYFDKTAVKGPFPKEGDVVLVQAESVSNMPFKWQAERVQILRQQHADCATGLSHKTEMKDECQDISFPRAPPPAPVISNIWTGDQRSSISIQEKPPPAIPKRKRSFVNSETNTRNDDTWRSMRSSGLESEQQLTRMRNEETRQPPIPKSSSSLNLFENEAVIHRFSEWENDSECSAESGCEENPSNNDNRFFGSSSTLDDYDPILEKSVEVPRSNYYYDEYRDLKRPAIRQERQISLSEWKSKRNYSSSSSRSCSSSSSEVRMYSPRSSDSSEIEIVYEATGSSTKPKRSATDLPTDTRNSDVNLRAPSQSPINITKTTTDIFAETNSTSVSNFSVAPITKESVPKSADSVALTIQIASSLEKQKSKSLVCFSIPGLKHSLLPNPLYTKKKEEISSSPLHEEKQNAQDSGAGHSFNPINKNCCRNSISSENSALNTKQLADSVAKTLSELKKKISVEKQKGHRNSDKKLKTPLLAKEISSSQRTTTISNCPQLNEDRNSKTKAFSSFLSSCTDNSAIENRNSGQPVEFCFKCRKSGHTSRTCSISNAERKMFKKGCSDGYYVKRDVDPSRTKKKAKPSKEARAKRNRKELLRKKRKKIEIIEKLKANSLDL